MLLVKSLTKCYSHSIKNIINDIDQIFNVLLKVETYSNVFSVLNISVFSTVHYWSMKT